MSTPDRRAMLDRDRRDLSIRRQCVLLSLTRSGVYRPQQPANDDDLALMRRIDALFMAWPFLGSRRMTAMLRGGGLEINRKRVRRLMRIMGIAALGRKPRTTAFCVEAVEEALARWGRPEIFNTDQGSQFTGAAFTGTLAAAGITISMDGRGCWIDNVFIERLWRSLKYEEVYLKGYADGREAHAGIAAWIAFIMAGALIRHWAAKPRWRFGAEASPVHWLTTPWT